MMTQRTPVPNNNRNLRNTGQYRENSTANVKLRQEVKALKRALSQHQKHSESVQQYRHELNRTVLELKETKKLMEQGEKHKNKLEETVERLETRYFGCRECRVIVVP